MKITRTTPKPDQIPQIGEVWALMPEDGMGTWLVFRVAKVLEENDLIHLEGPCWAPRKLDAEVWEDMMEIINRSTMGRWELSSGKWIILEPEPFLLCANCSEEIFDVDYLCEACRS